MGNYVSKVLNPKNLSTIPLNTPAGYMYNLYGSSTCNYLQEWANLTKSGISLRCSKWGIFDTSKLIFLHTQIEKAGSKIKNNEWEAYLD